VKSSQFQRAIAKEQMDFRFAKRHGSYHRLSDQTACKEGRFQGSDYLLAKSCLKPERLHLKISHSGRALIIEGFAFTPYFVFGSLIDPQKPKIPSHGVSWQRVGKCP
jgi:hypothetical protein